MQISGVKEERIIGRWRDEVDWEVQAWMVVRMVSTKRLGSRATGGEGGG